MNRTGKVLVALVLVATLITMTACSGGGGYRGSAAHGIRYGHYYGPRPWGYYPGYIDVDPDYGVDDGPIAVPLPEMGMPDIGGSMDMGMGMDMGAFDF